ncbi:hypothetical protein JCM9533A_47920 [Catenuloplanes niger JCM 9533]
MPVSEVGWVVVPPGVVTPGAPGSVREPVAAGREPLLGTPGMGGAAYAGELITAASVALTTAVKITGRTSGDGAAR